MTWRFALMIDPASAADQRASFADTFAVVDPGSPALSVGELSTQRGDGIFESIGVVDGHPQEVAAHLERLAHSAELCDLPAPNEEQWRQAVLLAAASAPGSGHAAASRGAGGEGSPAEGVIKLILSRGVEHGPTPTAWVTTADAPDNSAARTRGIRVVTLDRGFDSDASGRAPWLLLGAKTLSYAVNMAAIREARRRGADDAIFVSSDGIVLEAPTASVILRFGDRFVTPAHDGGILPGTTQVSLFAHLETLGHETAYEKIPVSALATADAAWLVSSVRLAAPVTAIDGAALTIDDELTASFNRYLLSPRD